MSDNTKKLEFRVNKEWAKFAEENSWAAFIPEFAKDTKGQEYIRVHGREIFYRIKTKNKRGEQTYECTQCGNGIKTAIVAHPIWDGPFPCSGSGQVHYETVPYCPKCEKEPNPNGRPIRV